ncbi:unnamed protein product [Effrenium voratum]|nr:unnamed protein product [Effrenium voratum]
MLYGHVLEVVRRSRVGKSPHRTRLRELHAECSLRRSLLEYIGSDKGFSIGRTLRAPVAHAYSLNLSAARNVCRFQKATNWAPMGAFSMGHSKARVPGDRGTDSALVKCSREDWTRGSSTSPLLGPIFSRLGRNFPRKLEQKHVAGGQNVGSQFCIDRPAMRASLIRAKQGPLL